MVPVVLKSRQAEQQSIANINSKLELQKQLAEVKQQLAAWPSRYAKLDLELEQAEQQLNTDASNVSQLQKQLEQ